MEYTNILGISIPVLNKQAIWDKIVEFLNESKPHYIVTVNAEIILQAKKDEEYFYILNHSDLNIIDGSGPKIATWLMGKNVARYPGADLVRDILRYSEGKQLKVAIVNWNGGLSKAGEILTAVKRQYPNLHLLVEDIDREWVMPYYQSLNSFQPDILLVTLGSPYQEKFITRVMPQIKSVRLAAGFGGAFDFITGKLKRAPEVIRFFGLEWLWRIIQQFYAFFIKQYFIQKSTQNSANYDFPTKRLKRIFNAVLVFPYKVFVYRCIYPFLYRPNVACLLYKNVGGSYYIFLVERADQPEHWQLPQGGIDGLSIDEAGAKELREEINCAKFKPIASFGFLWKYTFDKQLIKHKPTNRYYGYKGQKQALFIAEFTGQDSDIKINYWDHSAWKWVEAGLLIDEIAEKRRPSAEIYLKKFRETIKPRNL